MFLDNPAIQRRYSEFKSEKRSMLMRLKQDIADLDYPDELEVLFPDPSDITHLVINYTPDKESLWSDLCIPFSLEIPVSYPFKPPRLTCLRPPFHPNINSNGVVCLNIVREDWKPIYTLNHVIQGIISLFYSVSADDPLNEEAAKLMVENPIKFRDHCVKAFEATPNSIADLSNK